MPADRRAPHVLLLGGTAEARALAAVLVDREVSVVSSLAGRVARPRQPLGEVRIGGFGGVPGLVNTLRDNDFTHLVDATHPFAITMRRHAVEAAHEVALPVVRLARPGWRDLPDAAAWTWVQGYDEARRQAERLGSRPFITSGRQTLGHYLSWDDRPVLVRVVEPLEEPVPASWQVRLDRGPFSVDDERELMRSAGIDVLITKDSGGAYTSAKLQAASELGIPVVVVARPDPPEGLQELSDIDEVLAWLDAGASATA